MAATQKPRERRRQARSARAGLAWTLLWIVMIQAAVHAHLERRRPEVYDPEYAARLAMLNRRRAETPERPLLLVVGSSRLVTDFLPEQLPPLQTADGATVLPFNFAHTGAGPLINLMEVRRMLRDGVRPRWLVVEILPPMLNISGRSTAANLAQAHDLHLLRRHMPPWKAYGHFLATRLIPNTRHYLAALGESAPGWMPSPALDPALDLGPLGGSTPLHAGTGDALRCTEAVRAQYYPGLQNFRVTGVADQSLRDLLVRARQLDVEIVLLLTPESSEFRSWYPESARRLVADYCTALSREQGVRLIDARDWLRDEDFLDAHHALPPGAAAFTRRLGEQVLRPLVQGTLPHETALP